MKTIIHLLCLCFLMSACALPPVSPPAPPTARVSATIPSPEITLTSPTDLPTPTRSMRITIIPTKTNTQPPTPWMTYTPIPLPAGLFSPEELQSRIDDWVNGEIEFTDDDKLLDEKTGEIVPLGILAREFGNVIFLFYNLGFTVIYDKNGDPFLINIVGFEDREGERFTFVFHNGKLTDPYAKIWLKIWEGRRINHEVKISSDQLTLYEFFLRTEEMVSAVNGADTMEENSGLTGNKEFDNNNRYYIAAKETVRALAGFFQCQECSIDDAPPGLEKFINTIPLEFDRLIPYLQTYNVSYW